MITIDFDSLIKNANLIKSRLNGGEMCCVVKCDAYGHGIERCARYLQDVCDSFAVAYVDEANKIADLNKDILLMLPQNFQDTVCALKSNYIVTVDSFDTLDIIENVTTLTGLHARLHIKVDTGMHRLGFFENQLPDLLKRLKKLKKCRVEGIYSHFSCADCDEIYTNRQFENFLRCADLVEKHFGKLKKHIANTSAVFLDSKYALDMVRVGLGLFGYGGQGLIPVKHVTARVVSIKNIKKGDFVSYGNTFKCKNDMKIAVLDVGYAYGLSQMLSRKCSVFLNGKTLPVLGTICMGMCIVDASTVALNIGDKAEILGINNNILKDNADFSIYELLCNLK